MTRSLTHILWLVDRRNNMCDTGLWLGLTIDLPSVATYRHLLYCYYPLGTMINRTRSSERTVESSILSMQS